MIELKNFVEMSSFEIGAEELFDKVRTLLKTVDQNDVKELFKI
jgi:hypothetical protein